MKEFKNKVIIGIDHGYGNIKTANHVFKAGVLKSDTEPVFQTNMLVYGGIIVIIGANREKWLFSRVCGY